MTLYIMKEVSSTVGHSAVRLSLVNYIYKEVEPTRTVLFCYFKIER